MQLLASAHPVEVQDFLADDGVLKENLVELPELEEEDLLEVINF